MTKNKIVKRVSRIVLKTGKYTVKRLSIFPSSAGMSLTKLSLAGNNLIFPGHGDFGQ
jgi:hypothetical protein